MVAVSETTMATDAIEEAERARGRPLRLAVIGVGSRGGDAYADYCLRHPQEARVVAVADPRPARRDRVARLHDMPPEGVFQSWEKLLSGPQRYDGVLVTTPDRLHVEPALAVIEQGYDLLLEKPIAPDRNGLMRLTEASRRLKASVTICHVLRYTSFFSTIKRLVEQGRVGRLMSMQWSENIGYWHFAHSYVRGNWANSTRSSPMILAKSCHDMDMLRWLAGAPCSTVGSFGELSHFRPEQAPDGAPDRCIDGCPVYESCPYNSVTFYVDALEGYDGWPVSVISDDLSPEGRLSALREGPYGRCVYRCDNDVVDHQVSILRFENGVTATLNVCGTTSENTRTLKLMGSLGELRAHLDQGEIEVRSFAAPEGDETSGDERAGQGRPPLYGREVIEVSGGLGHAGGDDGLMRAFIDRVSRRRAGEPLEASRTSLEESLESHFMALAAEEARITGRVVHVASPRRPSIHQ